MGLIARDPAIYSLLDEPLRIGKLKGVAMEVLLEEEVDYIRYLLDNKIIVLTGEAEEAYRLAIIKLENRERDTSDYDASADAWLSQFDREGDDSIADYLND